MLCKSRLISDSLSSLLMAADEVPDSSKLVFKRFFLCVCTLMYVCACVYNVSCFCAYERLLKHMTIQVHSSSELH